MTSPFNSRATALSDPKRDIMPVTPDDTTDLSKTAVALYIETGGDLTFISAAGQTRSLKVPNFAILPVGANRVLATGTTASGIHMLVD